MFRVAMIADVHLGVLPVKQQMTELGEIFFHDLRQLDALDLIVVLGDVYDRKIYVNDRTTDLAIWFFQELIQIAREKHAKVRLIYGTKSHEANQYNLLTQVPTFGVDIQVIDRAQAEQIDGLQMLYLPEEHLYSKTEYYKELLYECQEKYQYIFGHGVINEIMKSDKEDLEKKKESVRLHVPKFTIGDFKQCCDGQVFFGHYHIHSEYDDFVHYVGSYSRWKFGEEEPKGYMISEYKKGKYANNFIENPLTPKYHTIFYGYDHRIFSSEDELIKEFQKIESLIEQGVFQFIRCMINLPSTLDNPDFYVNAFRERFRFSTNVKVEYGNGSTERVRVADKEKAKKLQDEYGYINEATDNIEVVTSKFMEQDMGKQISPDRIKQYMEAKTIHDLL